METAMISEMDVRVSYDWMKEFESRLETEGRSERTIQAYSQDVRSLALWYQIVIGISFEPGVVTGVDLRAWRRYALEVERVAPATWNRRRASMRVFTEWARGRGLLSYDVMQGVDVVEQVELPPRWLERKDLGRFMRQLEMGLNGSRSGHWRWQAVRDLAVAAMMVYAGLRDGEVCGLDVGDIALGDRSGRVMVRLGKGEKFRKVPLNGEARRAIRAWLEVRGAACGSLFIGKGGERISTRLVQRRMAEVGRQAGLVVRPHDLRHTFAKRLLDEGTPLTVVSKLLGHSRLETTARYVQPGWSDFEKAVEAI